MFKKFFIGVAVMILLASVILAACAPKPAPAPAPTPVPAPKAPAPATAPAPAPAPKPKTYSAPPAMTIDPNKKYKAVIETEVGKMVIELFAKDVPVTVNNFVFLARQGFYDGVSFHRVIENFVIQGGDPTGTGSGGPGYCFADEVVGNPLKHEAGVLSMANAGPNTNGSQFFITRSPQPHLNGKHTVFGKVSKGQDVVLAIEEGDRMDRVEVVDG